MKTRIVIHFVDNDAARFALIKGSPPTPDSAWMTGAFWAEEARAESFTWFERVPSPSSLADKPSRGLRPSDLHWKGKSISPTMVPLPVGFEALLVRSRVPQLDTSKGFLDHN